MVNSIDDSDKWITLSAKVKQSELPTLNQRLGLFGFNTIGQMVKDFTLGKFPAMPEDKEIEGLTTNINSNNTLTSVDGMFTDTFYRNVDYNRMRIFYIEDRKYSPSYAQGLVHYFKDFAREFFGQNPETINSYTPKKRGWILQAMKNFGLYYLRFYNDDRIDNHIRRTIKRYSLNRDLDNRQKVYIADDSFVKEKIKICNDIPGDLGFFIKLGMLSGLRQEELFYIREKPICPNQLACGCEKKLHITTKENGRYTIVVLNWFRGNKKAYFTIMPTEYWDRLRNFRSFDPAHIQASTKVLRKEANLAYKDLRKLHYNSMARVMKRDEADILAGRAKDTSAKHYALYELDNLTKWYKEAWAKYGVVA